MTEKSTYIKRNPAEILSCTASFLKMYFPTLTFFLIYLASFIVTQKRARSCRGVIAPRYFSAISSLPRLFEPVSFLNYNTEVIFVFSDELKLYYSLCSCAFGLPCLLRDQRERTVSCRQLLYDTLKDFFIISVCM